MTPAGPLPDDAVAAVSALAAAWVARAAPVRFGVATSAADIEAVHRLRYEVVVGRGWAPAHAFPDGLERDGDDAAAVHVAGWHRDRVVATGRLVEPRVGSPLPTEAAFGVTLSGCDQLVDIGRVCVASTYRDSAHRVFRGVLGQLWFEMRRRGYQEAVTVVTGAVARTYERWGLVVTILAPSRLYWGEPRSPARIAPAAAVDRLFRAVGTSARLDGQPSGAATARGSRSARGGVEVRPIADLSQAAEPDDRATQRTVADHGARVAGLDTEA
jgi:predicted GNAT family N-acyltransferase